MSEKEGQSLPTELDWLEEPYLGCFQIAIAVPHPLRLARLWARPHPQPLLSLPDTPAVQQDSW